MYDGDDTVNINNNNNDNRTFRLKHPWRKFRTKRIASVARKKGQTALTPQIYEILTLFDMCL